MKRTDPGYIDFGEAYFSWIEEGAIKAWKKHHRMTLNLVVPVGHVRFVFTSGLEASAVRDVELGEHHYCRLTVPPGAWFGFQGIRRSLILNLADMPHDDAEVDRLPIEAIAFDWSRP
jgi:dTDP-4-dehydrorhamnose 3,5-epimerase